MNAHGRRTQLLATARVLALICGALLLIGSGAALGMANHTGWPREEHHEGHPNNESGVMRGLAHVHNYLLGGNGNDTIYGGEAGDVIWGDSHPEDPPDQSDRLHGGNGNDFIYASDGFNEIWTGAGNDEVALVYGHGVVHCNGPGLKTLVMRYLPSNRPWQLIGCTHIRLIRYRA